MIVRLKLFVLIMAAAIICAACSAPAGNAPATNAAAGLDAGRALSAAPTANVLLALERQANEAYIKGDGKFFESFLNDSFVMQADGARVNKADAVRMISGVKCEVKDGWSLTEPTISRVDNDTYILSYRSNMEGRCMSEGKTEQLPSPVRAATVWTRNGEWWQAVFHGENFIVDPAAGPAADKKDEPTKDGRSTADATAPTTPASSSQITDELMAAERSVWEAWKNKDARRIEALTAPEITFVNIFGTYFANKADVVKDWTGPTCDVTGFNLTNGVGTAVSPNVGIVTLTGTVSGSCGGADISGQKIYANSVYVKDAGAWKWVFGFNSPSRS
jgi:ketosteroid isomerase-like protein